MGLNPTYDGAPVGKTDLTTALSSIADQHVLRIPHFIYKSGTSC